MRLTLIRWTTRRLMIAVAIVAAWLALVVSARRLRTLSHDQMTRSAQAVIVAADARPDHRLRPTPRSDWHLKMAKKSTEEADLLEALAIVLPIVVVLLGIAVPWLATLRDRKRRRAAGLPSRG
jgi:hypothetical protein